MQLSKRESEVADLLTKGCTAKEIACELGISVRTCNQYIARLYVKIGARGRGDCVAKIIDLRQSGKCVAYQKTV